MILDISLAEFQSKMALVANSVNNVPWDRFLANSKIPQGQTDEVLTWIMKVNQKKNAARSVKYRDYRKEAMLENSRRSAREFLQAKQNERKQKWKLLKSSIAADVKKEAPKEESICDCHVCFLCIRHDGEMSGKCYCSVIFNPKSMVVELPVLKLAHDEESRKVDDFLASLPSRPSKRSAEEEKIYSRKRCKA